MYRISNVGQHQPHNLSIPACPCSRLIAESIRVSSSSLVKLSTSGIRQLVPDRANDRKRINDNRVVTSEFGYGPAMTTRYDNEDRHADGDTRKAESSVNADLMA